MSHAKWSSHEEESCVRTLDRLVLATRQAHDEEARTDEGTDPARQAQRDREMQELRLFSEAIHGQDVIGLTQLTSGFWGHKNAMCRQKQRLEKVLPKRDESDELLESLRQLSLQVEDPKDAAAVTRLIDTVQRASFVDLARHAAEIQRRVCEQSPIVAAHQAALGIRGGGDGAGAGGATAGASSSSPSGISSSTISKQPHLMLSEEGQETRLADSVRVADASLQDAEMRAQQLREQLEGLFAGFEQLKLPRAMHSFIPRGISSGEVAAPKASSIVNNSIPRAVYRDAPSTTAFGGAGDQSSSSFSSAAALVNGHTTMHLLRVLCVEAAPHDTPEGLAAQYGVEAHCVTDVHQQPLPSLESFKEPTLVLIHIGMPLKGLEESLTSLARRIELIETTTLPRAKERLVSAKETLWSSELSALQAPLKGDAGVMERRRAVESLERDQKRAIEVLEQCKAHKDALLSADFGRVSFLLEAKQLEALEGLGASERLVYTCKEVPKGVTVADFAARMGIPAGELVTFVDEETGVTMAYVPTLVPRQSLVVLDEELRKEYNSFKAAHPELPPRTDLLEHLSALRAGDVSSLSAMLSSMRKELEAADVGKMKLNVDKMSAEITKLSESNETNQRVIDARNDTILLLRTQNDELRQSVIASKERADAADGALQSCKNDLASVEEHAREAQARCNAVSENLYSTEHRAANLQKELELLQRTHEEQTRQLHETSQDEKDLLTANRTAMQTQIESLASRSAKQDHEIGQLLKKLDSVTQQRDEARENAEKLRTQVAEGNVQVREVAVVQAEKHSVQAQLSQANAELAELKHASTSQVESLQNQVRFAEQKVESLTAAMKKLEEDTKKAIEARDLQLASVHEACRKQEATSNAAREAAETETAVLRRQLQNVTSDLATARADRWAKSDDIRRGNDPLSPSRNRDASASPSSSLAPQPGLSSPGRGLLDPPLAAGAGSSPARRVLYVCRPLPRGSNATQLAAEFGVSASDVVGPFTETQSGDQFCYVPTIASVSGDILREDERIRGAIVASAKEGLPSVTLLETLHALRSGDVASLAQKVLDGEERVAKAEALLALQARSDALSGVAGTHGMPSMDITDTDALLDDDHTHDSLEVLQQKITLLKDALASMRLRMQEWKGLADDYKQQLIAEQADDIDAEQIKADYEQRLDAKLRQINGLESEIAQLKTDLSEAEHRKEEELSVLALARQKLVADKDNTISNLKRQLDELRVAHDRTLKLLDEDS